MIVQRFLRWIETAPAGQRAEAAGALARAFLYSEIPDGERKAMEAAMTMLLDDPSPDVRFALADALSNSAYAPRHVILALAGDADETAAVILGRSPVLLDSELVDALAGGSSHLQAVIADRAFLSSVVSAAVAEVGDETACLLLAENPGAAIGYESFTRMVERWGQNPDVRQALLARPDLPLEIKESLVENLAQALRNLVSLKAWMDPHRAKEVTAEACDRARVTMAAQSEPGELAGLAEHLRIGGKLNARLLLRALCSGNLNFFESAVAVLAKLPESKVTHLVGSGRRGPLRALCRRAGLPMRAFEAFAIAIEACRENAAQPGELGPQQLAHETVERVLARYDEGEDSANEDLVALLRRLASESARSAAREYIEEQAAA